jgi:2-oxo-4-hydroxy-4-carboxy-5-ureidoimidazoline decarboxylase
VKREIETYTLGEVNGLSCGDFVNAVGPVFEHSPWIAEATWPRRPFNNAAELHRALCDTVREAGEE